jgi:hypothetical protein
MSEEKQNWAFYEDATNAKAQRQDTNQKMQQAGQHDASDEPTYENYLKDFDKFREWLENEARRTTPLFPTTPEEKTVYTCPGWRVYSPRWNEEEVLHNKKAKQWDAILIFSKPQSIAWVADHFPRCSVSPLRVSDRRQAESRLLGYRKRTKGMRKKDSYAPTDSDLGSVGDGDVL